MFKKVIASFYVTTLTLLSSPDTNNRPLNENALPKYAEVYIQALFGTHRNDPQEAREYINQVTTKALNSSKSNCEEYEWLIFPTGTFQRECVEQVIRSAALNQIISDSQAFGYGYTHDASTLTFIKESLQEEILELYQNSARLNGVLRNYRGDKLKERVWNLKKEYDAKIKSMQQIINEAYAVGYEFTHDESTLNFIKERLQNEIIQLIQKPTSPRNVLNYYRGENLKQRVWNLKKEYDQNNQTQQIKKYPSDHCNSCLESFSDVPRIFLTPCGHDMCKDCANEWLQRNNTCPVCRTKINGQTS